MLAIELIILYIYTSCRSEAAARGEVRNCSHYLIFLTEAEILLSIALKLKQCNKTLASGGKLLVKPF